MGQAGWGPVSWRRQAGLQPIQAAGVGPAAAVAGSLVGGTGSQLLQQGLLLLLLLVQGAATGRPCMGIWVAWELGGRPLLINCHEIRQLCACSGADSRTTCKRSARRRAWLEVTMLRSARAKEMAAPGLRCRGLHDRAGQTMQEIKGLSPHLEPAGKQACR